MRNNWRTISAFPSTRYGGGDSKVVGLGSSGWKDGWCATDRRMLKVGWQVKQLAVWLPKQEEGLKVVKGLKTYVRQYTHIGLYSNKVLFSTL
jgi:hypothetical protein